MHEVTEFANAKINLFLDVLDRRDDGFHSIRSVMHSVTLSDEITVTVTPSHTPRVILAVSGDESLVADESNLVFRAASLYLERSGISSEIRLSLKKHIPIGAGLGGGSTDAAATLRALNRAFGAFDADGLLLLAAELGSDVPFCLVGGTAICEGRGERITRTERPEIRNFVIALPDNRVMTPEAYAALDRIYSDFDGSRCSRGAELFAEWRPAESAMPPLYNIFEEIATESVTAIKTQLLSLGARDALMSGSGPAVFGIFGDEASASEAIDALSAKGITAFYAMSA